MVKWYNSWLVRPVESYHDNPHAEFNSYARDINIKERLPSLLMDDTPTPDSIAIADLGAYTEILNEVSKQLDVVQDMKRADNLTREVWALEVMKEEAEVELQRLLDFPLHKEHDVYMAVMRIYTCNGLLVHTKNTLELERPRFLMGCGQRRQREGAVDGNQ